MNSYEVSVDTGEAVIRPFSPEAIQKKEEEETADVALQNYRIQQIDNEASLQTKLETALTTVQGYRSASSAGLTAVQRLDRLESAFKVVCGVVCWLIRLRLRKLDAGD